MTDRDSLRASKKACRDYIVSVALKLGPKDCTCGKTNRSCFYCRIKDSVAMLAELEQRSPSCP